MFSSSLRQPMKATCCLVAALACGLGFPETLSAEESTPSAPEHVKQLDLIHFSHTDYGFTDHPAVCRDMQRRYLDIALDAALATRESARRGAVPLDGRNHRGRERLVAGGHARAPRAVPQGRPRRPDRSHRAAAQQHALPQPRPMADDDALAAGGLVDRSSSRRPPCKTT